MFAQIEFDDDVFDIDEHRRQIFYEIEGVVLPWSVRFSEGATARAIVAPVAENAFNGYGLDDFYVVVTEDSDQDGVLFSDDNCVFIANADQHDTATEA